MFKKIITIAITIAMLSSNAYAYSGVSTWADSMIDKANSLNIIPQSFLNANLSKVTTKGECALMCVTIYETISKKLAEASPNPFADEVSEGVLKAASLGIVGNFSGTDFKEDSIATREEIADMLAKTYSALTGENAVITNKTPFSDDENISNWAKESVYFIQEKGIIHIVGSNKFAPKNIDEEQTRANYANMSMQNMLICAVRLCDLIKPNSESDNNTEPTSIGEICLNMIPQIDFGSVSEPEINVDSASIRVENVTSDDYYAFIEKAKRTFNDEIYTLEGQNYKAWDGEYTINIVYLNGLLTVEVFKD